MKTKHLLVGLLLVGTTACGSNKTKDVANITKITNKRNLNQSFYFDFNSSKTFRSGKNDKIVDYRSNKVYLEGNCDSRGSDLYNDKLGQRRADYIKKLLVDSGISKDNINVVSNGKRKLSCLEKDEKCYSTNRRVDLFID